MNHIRLLNASTTKSAITETEGDINELKIKDECFIIDINIRGERQWGNSMYYYMSALTYLLQKGASAVFMPNGRVEPHNSLGNPIGVPNLDNNAYGPKANTVNKSDCEIVNPKYLGDDGYYGVYKEFKNGGPNGSNMQDLMEFREKWNDIKKDWPSEPFNLNLFETDFGVEPSIEKVVNTIGVDDWKDVLVIHIRQGDVMARANKSGPKLFIHSQPPCAFYEDVIETGLDGQPFPYVLIVTNEATSLIHQNACNNYLNDKYSTRDNFTKLLDYDMLVDRLHTVSSHAGDTGYNDGMRKDLYILTQAVNVAEGHSTFTMGTTLLNYNLKRHFYPSTPATINSVPQAKVTLNGHWVNTRQFYIPTIQQTTYVLHDWLGYNGSCNVYKNTSTSELDGNLGFDTWLETVTKESEAWEENGTNFTQKLLNYKRSSMVKHKTSDKPFRCDNTDAVSHFKDNSHWFIPCKCD